jgi:hypothetical protein
VRPNDFDPTVCACHAVLPVFCKEGWQDIAREFAAGLQIVWTSIPYGNSKMAKEIRKSLLQDITRYQSGEEPVSLIMSKLSKATDSRETNLQLMFSFADSPKFLIYKESDLHNMADKIEDHISEINAITYFNEDGSRICPYDPDSYHRDTDLAGTLYAQRENIKQFMIASVDDDSPTADQEKRFYEDHTYKIVDSITHIIDGICKDIEGYNVGLYAPTVLEKGFFDSCLYIRNYATRVGQRMRDYANGNASAEQFTLSESKSPASDSENVMYILHKLGYTKPSCPAVLSNIFYNTELQKYGIQKQLGQIDFNQTIAFHPAPGLGPAFKIRWVYSVDTGINNFLEPLAKLIQKADKIYDPNEAYNDQLKYLLANMQDIIDAYCTDSTGYSDYLYRVIYYVLMVAFYRLDADIVDKVMQCFRIPIQIHNKVVGVEFGAMQGEKLLVFIMNHANRLMGIIADRIQNDKSRIVIRPNAGDDVVKAVVAGNKFRLEDILIEMTVFACFNSPTNFSKAAWAQRDKYFDFCSKYFSMVDGSFHCVSGVPAKKYGKEIVCISDWAETFKVLDSANQKHESCTAAFKQAIPFIQQTLSEGLRLPNIYDQHMTLEDKISNARHIPYTMGGISDNIDDVDFSALLHLSRYKLSLILEKYTFNPRGLYLVVNRIMELQGTALLEAIGSVSRTNIQKIVKMIRMCAEESISHEELKEINDTISSFERNIIVAMSHSRTSSTYHRLERNKDVDILFNIKELTYDSSIPLPESAPESLFLLSLLTNRDYLDIDNIRNYLKISEINHKYGGLIVCYEGVPNTNTYYGIKDPSNGKIIRLYNNDDDRYDRFEPIWNCKHEDIKFVVNTLRASHVDRFIDALFAIGNGSVEDIAEQYAKEIIEDTNIDISEQLLANILKSIDLTGSF